MLPTVHVFDMNGYDYCFEKLFNKNFFQPHLYYYKTSGIIGIMFLYVLLFFSYSLMLRRAQQTFL